MLDFALSLAGRAGEVSPYTWFLLAMLAFGGVATSISARLKPRR